MSIVLAIAARLLGSLKGLVNIAGGVLRWLFARPERVIVAALLLAIVLLAFRLNAARDSRDRWQAISRTNYSAAVKWRDLHDGLAARARQARIDAAAADAANARRVAAEFDTALERITHENDDLRARNLALLDQRLSRPASSRTGADPGGGAAAAMPGIPLVSDGALQDADLALVSRTDLRACADNNAQLVGLIAAWTAAAAIDVNGVDLALEPQPQ